MTLVDDIDKISSRKAVRKQRPSATPRHVGNLFTHDTLICSRWGKYLQLGPRWMLLKLCHGANNTPAESCAMSAAAHLHVKNELCLMAANQLADRQNCSAQAVTTQL